MSMIVSDARRRGRVQRTPQHTFQLRTRPWQIQPFLLAPVVPGETMKNLLLQARVVTDPVKNPLIGWWNEYYFFYVKHRDLDDRAEFTNMMLDIDWDPAPVDSTVAVTNHYFHSGIDWVDLCLKRVCAGDAAYFRNEGEAWNEATLDGLPLAAITGTTWADSLMAATEYTTDDVSVSTAGDNAFTVSELETAMQKWELMRTHGLIDMTYDDYLRTYGIRPRPEEAHIPELVRFVRQWSYPSNTIDPSDGAPSSAVSWTMAERADKDRFFKEPGFLFGVTVCRPKVYWKNQLGNIASYLRSAFNWLPAVMSDDPRTSMQTFPDTATGGPLGALATDTGGYWIDLKDLFLYGDQFVNFALTATDAGLVALPTAALGKRYVSEADIDGLFSDVAGGREFIRQDGIVSLSIAGRQSDTTPTT